MKKVRAARSASETQLRSKATSYVSQKTGRKRIASAVTAARVADAISGGSKKKSNDPIYVESEAVTRSSTPGASSRTESPNRGAQFVRSERVGSERVVRQIPGSKKPAALPAPKSSPKPKGPKSSKGPKKEKTPGMQTVFKATPVVDLREGPNFGNVTSEIEKTTQPKPPKQKKNA